MVKKCCKNCLSMVINKNGEQRCKAILIMNKFAKCSSVKCCTYYKEKNSEKSPDKA